MDKKIREFAEQAGAKYYAHADYLLTTDLDIEQFASLIRQDEREECAKVCDEKAKRNFNWGSENADRYHAQADWAEHCAAAIRARINHD